MSATWIARAGAALAVAIVVGAGCSSARVTPSGSTPAQLPGASAPSVTDEVTTTTQVPSAPTPLVRQAVLDYWTALRTCQQRPTSCNPASFTAAQGSLRGDVASAVTTMVDNGWHRAADQPDDTSTPRSDGGYTVVGAVTIGPDGTTATAEACVDDPAPMLGPSGAVVTTGSGAHHFVYSVYLEHGTWIAGDEQIDSSDVCDIIPDTVPPDFTTPGS
jgi:hypothetical protein